MDSIITPLEDLAQLCAGTDATTGPEGFVAALRRQMPELDFRHVMTRGNWHRLGGVVDANYRMVNRNLARWVEDESEGDVDVFIEKYLDAGYFVTSLSGKTHYFCAPTGQQAHEFIQIEIEEMQEVLQRPLLDRDWYPDHLEELIDPLDFAHLEPEPIGQPYYQFRRMTMVPDLVDKFGYLRHGQENLRRFLRDWDESSAGENALFCEHWILALREYTDSDGDVRITAKPVNIHQGEDEQKFELPPGERIHGGELASAIHSYDRALGYPFAWFFIMLSQKSNNDALAHAVLRDQMGAYDYLPARDLKVLRVWATKPYGV